MLIHLPKLLTPEQINQINLFLEDSDYSDGKSTAAGIAYKVKNNLQLISSTESGKKINNYLHQIILNDPRFWNITFFKEILAFTISRYEMGMGYGLHLDTPTLLNSKFRTDISMTLHLNSPNEYQGGELIIHSDFGVHTCKAEAGDAILYPANLLHEVKPITAGKRIVAITWIQSSIRDPQQRSILLDLINIISQLEKENHSQILKTQKVFNNLLRKWAEY